MADSRLPLTEAEALVARALAASRVSADNAASVARALVAAEADGQKGHGLSRVASYAAQARSGKVDGHATPVMAHPAPAVLAVDAAHGFAFPALDIAVAELARLAPRTGLACAAIRRSHHCGQLGAPVERLAERGFVALMVANTPKAMAPWGGRSALFGTNPIAFAAPLPDGPPLVVDLSLSEVARGRVMAAAKAGEPIPEGWALDATGRPTTDPEAALAGTMIPAGGAKGAALALMVEVLAASLVGATPSREASSFFEAEGPPPGVGQLLVAFDPAAFGNGGLPDRVGALAAAILAEEGARLPGARRLAARAAAATAGVAVPARLLAEITALADGG